MAIMSWDDKYSVNVREIDEQHKKIVQMVNELHDAMSVGKGKEALAKVLQSLIDYAGSHFATEEKYMTRFKFPGYPEHKGEHDAFVKRVLEFQDGFNSGKLAMSMEVMQFLKDWLLSHIQGTDKKYGPFFNENGIK